MAQTQMIGRLGYEGIRYAIAGKAENVVSTVVFGPFHRRVASVMPVPAPHQFCLRPVLADTPCDVLHHRPYFATLGRLGSTQDGHHRCAARDVIDVHRRKAALVMMRIPERQLLTAVGSAERVINIEDLPSVGSDAGAEL